MGPEEVVVIEPAVNLVLQFGHAMGRTVFVQAFRLQFADEVLNVRLVLGSMRPGEVLGYLLALQVCVGMLEVLAAIVVEDGDIAPECRNGLLQGQSGLQGAGTRMRK